MRSDALRRALTVLCSAAALGGCAEAPAERPAGGPRPAAFTLAPEQLSKVKVETVAPATFRRSVETTGTVAFDADRATQVIAPISGPVARLLVRVGAHVKRDQPLAVVSSPDFAAAVGAYRKGEAAARNARRIADLDQELLKNDAIARREAEQAEADATGAEADRDAAVEQLRSLGVGDTTLEDVRQGRPVKTSGGEIRSPVDGTVVEKLITPGQLLQAGATPCFTVADLSSVWVMADVFESSLPDVAVGDPAEITAGGARGAMAGTVDYISALVDPNTRAISVRIVARNPGDSLKKDMYVRVRIRSKRDATGVLLPASAVLRNDENLPFVYVQNHDGSFGRRPVTLGAQLEQRYEIRDGLAAGESVAVEGGLFMQFAESQ
jgi:membrane fusion protein, heavy metal efflux system